MKVSPVYIPGWLFITYFSLIYTNSDFGDRMYFPTKTDMACWMAEDPSCDGPFISMIVTACGHQRKAGHLHNSRCKGNRDCRIRKSVCYDGVCLCRPGLYFSPRRNACLRRCGEYGDRMDIYKGIGIWGHNDKTWCNTTLTSCCDLCVREKVFTCLTADWERGGQCHLSKSGYGDVMYLLREHDQHDWYFAQRRCK